MIGLTQNWTKTFMHTSQLYFSRNRSLGLNEFSNVTDVSAQLGLTGISPNPFDYGLPSINFTNFTGLSDPNFSLARSQTYRYVDSLRWMKDETHYHRRRRSPEDGHQPRHRSRAERPVFIYRIDDQPTDRHRHPGRFSRQLPDVQSPPGHASETISPISFSAIPRIRGFNTANAATYFRNWGFVGYASDDWHMFPKFTLTYGLRYEAFTPPTEINGHIANLAVNSDFTQVQCVTPVPTGNCLAGPTASLFNGHYNNWAPRLGIAWQPPGKWFSGQHQMTFRAGFSMFYVESYLNTLASEMANQPPFATANTLTQQTATTVP